ncbi:MAG: indolepyruvate ferredoxin oxidoreductase family protein [Proteobacteria bacterium]|nr:indolepyruvate ferredoxin oxidoreductase family protein [Pseudomonadota bacterium]
MRATADEMSVSASRYGGAGGRIVVSGTQALIRLLIEQSARDRADGLRTAGYVSGYRGSPLAGFDREIEKAGRELEGTDILFQPGLNEDLAATAVWGTQQLGFSRGARHDGVFALWYGKGPGIDRSMDAIRHANAAGTAPKGGVLLLMGDDHGAVSSTLPHQSEHNLISAMVPILSPSGVDDYVRMGLHGIAMSRFCGAWVGLKCQTEIVESSSSLELPPRDWRPALPDFALPPGGLSIRWPDPKLAQEARLEVKLAAAQAYARANGLDRISGGARAQLGIVTTGKAWRDLVRAFEILGTTPERAGIRVLRMGLVWPADPETLHRFRAGLTDILVVEEKRPVLEDQIRALFYGLAGAPRLWGKTTPEGVPLLPSIAEFDARMVAAALNRAFPGRLPVLEAAPAAALAPAPGLPMRVPYFCSGCPHSVSTSLPDGSRAIAGIGCSMLAVDMDRNVETFTQMGGEGANWLGVAPFTDERHIFVHMGDGTYFHSGLLAIRAAVAAKVTATYKILFNDAVAMTGGQPHDGPLSVPAIVGQLCAEGLREVVVVSERPELLRGQLPGGVKLLHRDHMTAEQARLRAVPGVTAIVYDQVCAAEKRRRRKRGTYPAGPVQVVINPAVCEGCGDCSVQSNCIAVEPLETPLGTKRRINQSVCNTDTSCLKGFCPSFVTIRGTRKKAAPQPLPEFAGPLPDPVQVPPERAWNLLLTGIGGTGVITVSAILAQAAQIDGLAVLALDQTGLAQKNGAVMSHLHFALDMAALTTPRIGEGEADAVLAFDTVVAASPRALGTVAPGRTRLVADAHVTPTAGFVQGSRGPQHLDLPVARLRAAAGEGQVTLADATGLALRHFGDGIAANILLTGLAFQKGLIPLSAAAIETAIRMNGAGVDRNLAAFGAGRRLALHPERFAAPEAAAQPDRAALKARHIADLTAWQDPAYAGRYAALVARAEAKVGGMGAAGEDFLLALMRGARHVMAWKDEYEVARLHSDPDFLAGLSAGFEGTPRLAFHLAPPFLPGRDRRTGRPRKREFGPWVLPLFRLLARMKRLRGTAFDPFGLSRERREERRLRDDWLAAMEREIAALSPGRLSAATARAAAVLEVVGFGPVKAANLERYRRGGAGEGA